MTAETPVLSDSEIALMNSAPDMESSPTDINGAFHGTIVPRRAFAHVPTAMKKSTNPAERSFTSLQSNEALRLFYTGISLPLVAAYSTD